LAPTLGDVLKEATNGTGRVEAVSLKDRACVLLGGHRADACYWFDSSSGTFITSTYYRDTLHPWVEQFNLSRPANRWFDRDWAHLRSDLNYDRYSGADDQVGEGNGIAQGRTFPHPMRGGLQRPSKLSYEALNNSPFGNEMLLALVKSAIDAEKLGTRATPDLLAVSFSCNDYVVHCWGPDSQEVLDVTLRSDLIVKELLSYLDTKVGKGRYTLVLTADHGVCPLPEVARAHGKESGRIAPLAFSTQINEFLDRTYGNGKGTERWLEADLMDPWVYLNRRLLRQHDLKQAEVEQALADWLKKQPGIQSAYTRTQLSQGVAADDALGQSVSRSFHPERTGDVAIIVKPYYQFSAFLTGTTHGTPHWYDTHVPLVVFGPGVRSGVRQDPVTPLAAAPILARALGLKPPALVEVPVPEGLFASQP
jgi:hypothetical protein